MFLAEGSRTASIQKGFDCFGLYHPGLERERDFRLAVENTGHVCPDPVQESPRFSLFFAKSYNCWRKGTLVAMAKARSEKKKISTKAPKTKFLESNAMHKAKHGRAFNQTGTAHLLRHAAHRASASEWNRCRLLCGFLFRFAQLVVLRCSFT